MRKLAVFLICLTAAASDPTWLTNLSNSTYIWSPYPVTSMPGWGGSYFDGHHTSAGLPLAVTRVPAIPSTCYVGNWTSYPYPVLQGVFYNSQYWMIPYSSSVGGTTGVTPSNPPWNVVGQSDVCAARSVVTSYSGRQAFNSTQTEFYVIAANDGDAAYFYKWNGGSPTYDFALLNTSASTSNGDESWSHTNPNLMTYANRAGYSSGDVCPGSTPCLENITITPGTPSTAAITTEHSWTIGASGECPSGTTYVMSGGDSNLSEDDRYRVLWCASGSGATPTRLIVYDYTTHSVSSSRDISAICGASEPIDIVTMSPDGDYVIVSWEQTSQPHEDTWTTCHGIELFDRATLTSQGMIGSIDEGHMDVGRDVNGIEVAAFPVGNSFSYESTTRYKSFNAVKLADVHVPQQGGTWDSYGEVDLAVTAGSTNTILQFGSSVDFSKLAIGAYMSDKTTAGSPVATNVSSGGLPGSTVINRICKTTGSGCVTANTIVMNHAATGVISGDVIAFRQLLNASYVRRLYLPCTVYNQPAALLTTAAATTAGATLSFTSTVGVVVGQTAAGTGIPDGTTVLSYVANVSVLLSASVTGSGVASGAQISFIGDPYTGCASSVIGSMTQHMSGRGAGSGTSQGWFLYSIFSSPGLIPQAPGWGRNEAIAVRIDTTQPVVSNATFRRVANMMAYREEGSQTQCSQGQDYWQEPHATASPDFSKILFTSSWLKECGQTSVFSVNLGTASMTVTPLSQTVAGGVVSWTVHNPAASYTWSLNGPSTCSPNSGSGSGDGSTVASSCGTQGNYTLTVADGTTTVYPTFYVSNPLPLSVTPASALVARLTNVMFTASGGVPPYTWSALGATTTTGTGTTFTTSWATGNTYTVALTDSALSLVNAMVSAFNPPSSFYGGNVFSAGKTITK